MKLIYRWGNKSLQAFLCFFVILSSVLLPSASIADVIDLGPEVTAVSKGFSEKFCIEVLDGESPDVAGENAAKKMARGLVFSPVIKEIMASPREDLALSLSQNIFDGCGNELSFNKEELDDYLMDFANKAPAQPKSMTTNRTRDPLKQLLK